MELIPGLPDEVGRECLIRVPYDQFALVSSVCRGWKLEIELPGFLRHRKDAGYSRSIIVMAQGQVDSDRRPGSVKYPATPTYRLTLCEPETGMWHELPPVPGLSGGLPMFCRLAGVGSDLVLMGGWDPNTWEVSNSVFIYNFVSATWRRGTEMPGSRRSFFGCASDFDRTVFVAGGHDSEKNALRSALAYDVAKDEWINLPDMARERDECTGIFNDGKFHVIGGYCTDMQGRFGRSSEAFDVMTWQWDQLQSDFLEASMCPRSCTTNGGKLYMCREGKVAALRNATWQAVAELPADVRVTACVTTWRGKLLVIGSERFGERHSAYVLDLQGYAWTRVAVPAEFSGHVQAACCLEI